MKEAARGRWTLSSRGGAGALRFRIHGRPAGSLQTRTRSAALSLVELLIAVSLVSVACIPLFQIASGNLVAARLEKVRLEAESVCHNTLQRFGHSFDDVEDYLKPVQAEPGVLEGDALFVPLGDLNDSRGQIGLKRLISDYGLKMKVRLRKNVIRGLDALSCEVRWFPDPGHTAGGGERLIYTRLLLRDETR